MKLLCTSDLHGQTVITERILKVIEKEKIDVFLIAGDFHHELFAQQLFEKLRVRTFGVLGNVDWGLDEFENEHVAVKNWGLKEYTGYYFLLVGNRIPRNFVEIALEMTKNIDSKKLVFLTHFPPFGIQDIAWNNNHVGLNVFREFIDIKQPILHAFGHIHEDAGFTTVNGTLAVNCAVPSNNRCYIVELPEQKVTTVDL